MSLTRLWSRAVVCSALLLASTACADLLGKGDRDIDDDDFDIDVEYYGTTPAAEVKSAVAAAAARLEQVVVGDVEHREVGFTNPLDVGECFGLPAGTFTYTEKLIDDVVMVVRVDSVDGPSTILAHAGPCLIRDNHNNETVIGTVTIDSADAASMVSSGRLTEVLTHEFLHVLGIGSSWEFHGLLQGKGTTMPRVTGASALAECRGSAGGSGVCDGAVPAEDCENLGTTSCGAGTLESHWKESTFESEMMTGYVESGSTGANKLSRITIGALQDLGYVVDFTAADAYTVPAGAAALRAGESTVQQGQLIAFDRVRKPRFLITPQKVLIRIGQP